MFWIAHEVIIRCLKRDYREAALNKVDRARLDYVAKVTLAPATVIEEEVLRLRKLLGGRENAIQYQITPITSGASGFAQNGENI